MNSKIITLASQTGLSLKDNVVLKDPEKYYPCLSLLIKRDFPTKEIYN